MNAAVRSNPTSTPARVVSVGRAGIADAAIDVEVAGHEVLRVSNLDRALAVIVAERPDVVIVETSADDARDVLAFCGLVRDHAAAHTAVLLLEPPPVTEVMRKEAWRAGVWHIMETPVDAEELCLRIDLAVAVRREADRALASSLVDVETGLYNAVGLARRTRELSAEAMRTHAALACIVIAASVDGAAATRAAAARSAEVLRTLGRLSDIVGRVGPLEYVVLAPATTASGAAQLARRLAVAYRVALVHALPEDAQVRTQAGYCSLSNLAYAPLEAADILSRATTALRSGRAAPGFEWLNLVDAEARTPAS